MGEIGWNFTTVRRGHQEWDWHNLPNLQSLHQLYTLQIWTSTHDQCCFIVHDNTRLFWCDSNNKITIDMHFNHLHLHYIYIHLSHLADALIQSDLQIGAFTLWHPVEQPLYNVGSNQCQLTDDWVNKMYLTNEVFKYWIGINVTIFWGNENSVLCSRTLFQKKVLSRT
jgi:hypothetical protein